MPNRAASGAWFTYVSTVINSRQRTYEGIMNLIEGLEAEFLLITDVVEVSMSGFMRGILHRKSPYRSAYGYNGSPDRRISVEGMHLVPLPSVPAVQSRKIATYVRQVHFLRPLLQLRPSCPLCRRDLVPG